MISYVAADDKEPKLIITMVDIEKRSIVCSGCEVSCETSAVDELMSVFAPCQYPSFCQDNQMQYRKGTRDGAKRSWQMAICKELNQHKLYLISEQRKGGCAPVFSSPLRGQKDTRKPQGLSPSTQR